MAATGRNENSLEEHKPGEIRNGQAASSRQLASKEDEAENEKVHGNENCGETVTAENEQSSKDPQVNEESGLNMHDVEVPQKSCLDCESPEDCDEAYFSYTKPLPKPTAVVSSPFLPRIVATNLKKLQGPIKEIRKVESETSSQEQTFSEQGLKKAVASKGEQRNNDFENNLHGGRSKLF